MVSSLHAILDKTVKKKQDLRTAAEQIHSERSSRSSTFKRHSIRMDEIVDTFQYNAGNEPHPLDLPHPWQQYSHPNGDFYFYNREWRVLTTDDVCDSDICRYVGEAVEDLLQNLGDDPNAHLLSNDYEIVVTEASALAPIRLYSRSAGTAFSWTEETGLEIKTRNHFWTFVAEFPSHHRDLPPNTEAEFVLSLHNTSEAIANNPNNPFTADQIEQLIARYERLIELRSQGYNTNPNIAWMIGIAMPLDAEGRHVNGESFAAIMNGFHT